MSSGDVESGARVHGVLVTFRRPIALASYLQCLTNQSRQLDTLVVVDNDVLRSAKSMVDASSMATYIAAGDNLGPAGGLALGIFEILPLVSDDDWIVLLDDDDPPGHTDQLRQLLAFAEERVSDDERVGGVGLVGALYNYRRGRTERVVDSALSGTVSVHLLGGGALPMYRAKAIRSVGLPDRSLFFGFEELEYGLRFVADGWRLLVDGDEWRRLREETDRSSLTRRDLRSSGSHASWRNYYSTRNQIIIARRFGGAAAVMLSSIDGLARAVRSILRRKHRGNVVMIGRGLIDGWSSRTGRVVEPPLAK